MLQIPVALYQGPITVYSLPLLIRFRHPYGSLTSPGQGPGQGLTT